ncbi:hypothetical protein IU501_32960 [Nocardia otitidiscaviarum]|uniref:hypothetical protein n=1 Tax=Nocardia otitidiscaviarum TaxID=1823 RepID=UPI0004A74832|nr:hypothetical protein [Nocardia otitidiscaviarum]MBF6137783.1 hypothetical protein [Nocardia otitidiscaviarum]MBF6485306.1 hypothetical protein [Nocardia otitidiscaviarum]
MADTLAGQQPDTLAAAVAATIAAWRAENPTAKDVPRSVRREISRAVRTDTRAHQLDASITRAQVQLEILHHQKALVALGPKPDSTPEDNAAYTAWARKHAVLSDAALALERRIHELPHLSATERGQAVRALERAHTVPSSEVQVKWAASGMESLKARVAEKVSAVRMGVATVTGRVARFGAFWIAQRQAAQIKDHLERRSQDWLTPGQAASLAELSTAAKSFETASQQARAAKDAQTDLATMLSEFHEAFTRTQQMGVSSERINQELRTAHAELEADGQRPQGMWAKIQAAARAPLTPPTAAAAGTQPFAFGSAPAAQAAPLAAAARRSR